jgi:hypothetical protein
MTTFRTLLESRLKKIAKAKAKLRRLSIRRRRSKSTRICLNCLIADFEEPNAPALGNQRLSRSVLATSNLITIDAKHKKSNG